MADSEQPNSLLSRRALFRGGAVAGVAALAPQAAIAAVITPTAAPVAATGAASNIKAMAATWKAQTGEDLPRQFLRSLMDQETSRHENNIEEATGISWQSFNIYQHACSRLKDALDAAKNPDHLRKHDYWHRIDHQHLLTFTRSLLIVEALSAQPDFMQANAHMLKATRATNADLAANDLPNLHVFALDEMEDTKKLMHEARQYLNENGTSAGSPESMTYTARLRMMGGGPLDFLSPDLCMQAGLRDLLASDRQHGMHIDCPQGNVGSLRITPCRPGEKEFVPGVPEEQRELVEQVLDRMQAATDKEYFARYPVDPATLNDNEKRYLCAQHSIDYRHLNSQSDTAIADALRAADPLSFASPDMSPKKRESLSASIEWGVSLVSRASNLVDLLARLDVPEPDAYARKAPEQAITPGRQVALEHLNDLNPQGLTIDHVTGEITIHDEALATAVSARREEVLEEDRGERMQVHAARVADPIER